MVLALLAENFGDERNCAEDVEDDGHKAIPPTGMFSVDGTNLSFAIICTKNSRFAA